MLYTSIDQSRRLVELGLDPKTADLHYDGKGDRVGYGRCLCLWKPYKDSQIPAWSLSVLLALFPVPYQMTRKRDGKAQLMLITIPKELL